MKYKKNADGSLALDEKGEPIVIDEKAEDEEVKEITLDGLKSLIGGIVSESVKSSVEEVKNELKGAIPKGEGEVKKEAVEKAADFIRKLVSGDKPDTKAVSSESASFGYTVPTELANAILTKRDKLSKMRKYAFVFRMAGNFQLPTEGTAVTAYWVGENEEVTESNPTISKKDLVDYYLAARVLVPRKLINTSAVNVLNYVVELCARAIRNTEETAFVAGDGSSKPTGLRSASLTGSVAQAGSALAYSDIVNLYFALKEQYRQEAVWLTSATGMKAIRTITDDNGIPIFDTRDQTMFGRPVLESEDIPANLGSSADTTEIYFGDPWYYWIKDGEDLTADTDKIISKLQTEIVVFEAVDGVLTNVEAFKKMTGVK